MAQVAKEKTKEKEENSKLMEDLDNLNELDKLNMNKPADDDDLLAGLEELDKKEKADLGKIKDGFKDQNLAKNITIKGQNGAGDTDGRGSGGDQGPLTPRD